MSAVTRSIVRRLLSTLVAALALAALTASSAAATTPHTPQPWWHVSQLTRPSYISTPKGDEVQEVQDELTEGLLILAVNGHAQLLPYNATAAEVQTALEGEELYGAGNVEVSGGPAGRIEGIVNPLTVTTINEHADEAVAPIEVAGFGQPEGAYSARVVFEPSGGKLIVSIANVGDATVEGAATPVTITDTLPASIAVAGTPSGTVFGYYINEEGYAKSGERQKVSCAVANSATVTCEYAEAIAPGDALEVVIPVVTHSGAASGEENRVSVAGGGAPGVASSQPVTLTEAAVPFGAESYEVTPEAQGGGPAAQAGSHPFQLTTAVTFDQTGEAPYQPAQPRTLKVDLPAGLVGSATAVPQCTLAQFDTLLTSGADLCAPDTAVGVAVSTYKSGEGNISTGPDPVFNLVPAAGEPVRFGMLVGGAPIVLNTSLRSGSDYGVTVTVEDLTENIAVLSSLVTIWGEPGAASHDASRGWACLSLGLAEGTCSPSDEGTQKPLLSMPTECASSLQSTLALDSWSDATFLPFVDSSSVETLDGCNLIPFEPTLALESSTHSADTPTELGVHLKVPQEASEAPEGIAESDVRNTTVTLPAGLQINPAAAAGLQACSEEQMGYTGERIAEQAGGQTRHRTDFSEAEAACPEASKLGTVKITTPLLSEPLEGYVYQAAQGANPFNSLLALYVVAESKKEGVRVKLAGKVEPNKSTGQLVTTFEETPQLPFAEFDLKFFGGAQGPIATSDCGAYRTESSIEPWSGAASANPFSEFSVTSGANGAACASPGFAPTFVAGTENNDGGAFSPFTTTLTSKDGEQPLSTVAMTLPQGLSADLSKVTLCGEAQANAGDCPAASKIGHVVVKAGVGGEPITLPEAGKPEDPVYLTGPYDGAPFGLSVVVPAEAGPFNLDENGLPVVVRGKIEVNPHTAQVSIQTTPMPTRLQGIPLDVRSVEVIVDKEGFMFNPTNCAAAQVSGAIGSSEGASENVASRFQAADCASLPFKPGFSPSTRRKYSRRNGAKLEVVVTSGEGQANIKAVKVTLPHSLVVRESTIEKACTEAQFAANPAGCPEASVVGSATVSTPVLSVPLKGPAYFVSRGGKAFPEIVMILQGDGVTIDLAGETFISKKGVTTSTFDAVPDVPFSRFDLTLPEGTHSLLAADGSPCRKKLYMPTKITGQNGAVISHKTKIEVDGCKPAIEIVSHRVKGATATLVVRVPDAGTLVASGKRLSRAVKKLGKAKTATVKLELSKRGRRLLANKPNRRLKETIELRFNPKKHGKTILGHVTVLIR